MGISWGEAIAEDPLSVTNANAMTWGVGWLASATLTVLAPWSRLNASSQR